MALVFMPGQFHDRADFYHQVSTLISAGFGLPNALEHLRNNPPARGFRRPLSEILLQLQDGNTFAEALRHTGSWMPEFDTALLEAGEKSGRLDACLKLLANYYQERMRLSRTVFSDMAYPVFLLHAALFLLGLPRFVLTGDWQRYLLLTLGVLVPIYLAVFVGIILFQGSRGFYVRLTLEKFVGFIPLLGRARKNLALARLAMALESLLSAGVNVINAWELSASASGSPTLQREVLSWRPQIEAGVRPSELLQMSSRFPDVFTNLYTTGEASGRLDDHLNRMHIYYHEAATHTLRQLATWGPRLVYLAIVGFIAYFIIKFWTGYFQQVSEFSTF